MASRWLLLCVPLATACATRDDARGYDHGDASTVEAGVEAGERVPDAGAPAPGDGDVPVFTGDAATSGQCQRSLAVGALTISESACFVNQHVQNLTATLTFPCAGGSAQAVFSGHTFTGTASGDVIALQDVEPFLFNSCQWQSTETITGDLASGTLSYTYAEKPVVSCPDLPCTANGSLQVSAGAVTVVK